MVSVDDKKSDIIFSSLPAYLDFLARIFRKCGHRVFYLRLFGPVQSVQDERQRAVALREAGIVPLPLEYLPRLVGVRKNLTDPEKKLKKKVNQLAPITLLKAFEGLYPGNTDVVNKLRTVVQSISAGQISIVGQVNCWAEAHPGRKILLIYPGFNGLLVFDLASNVSLLIVPLGALVKGLAAVARIARKLWNAIAGINIVRQGDHAVKAVSGVSPVSDSRVVFVTHAGLSYGKLFQKTLFYSDRSDSKRHPENLLHFDYSGFPSPSENIRWVCLGSERQSLLAGLYHVPVAISRGIVHIRSIPQIIGLLLLSRFYATFMSYSKRLEAYPDLKVALIDYEILCPMALLLAFDARNIKTVAAQERFFGAFYETMGGTILNTYLCGSEYVAEVMKKSPAFYAKHYLPVGQYRSDNLVTARQSPPPQLLEVPITQGRKIITALGFHTHMDWYNSQPDPLLNWSAHRHFLEDMIRLSRDIPNVFIILRYKFVDWVSLPVFAEAVREIASSGNMAISMDYEKSFFSYDLCANSHLVIAKHTSLGDECLAVGIPVLFHEYTHNTEQLVANAFDYSPARIMCFNYQELLERSRMVLSDGSQAMTPDYEYLKRVVYGGLGDGNVQERIHAHIDSLLA